MRAYIELIGGVEGRCVGLSHDKDKGGRRIAGPKPWGGGRIIKTFITDFDDILDAIPKEILKKYLNTNGGE